MKTEQQITPQDILDKAESLDLNSVALFVMKLFNQCIPRHSELLNGLFR